MLNEQKKKFCELYAYKEDLKLTHDLIAVELGISVKTIQRWLKEPEVISEINNLCASRLDRLIPTLTANTESLLNSKSSADKVKGMDAYWHLQNKLDRIKEGSNLSREHELIQKGGTVWLEAMKDILTPEMAVKLFMESTIDYVISKKYQNKVSVEELEKFLKEHGIS